MISFEINSSIITNKDDFTKLINLLSNQIKIYNIKLLYIAKRDGLKLDNLKEKINNKSNLLFLFLIGDTRIFGLYIKVKVEVKHDSYVRDENAFVFSLNNNKIYKILEPQYSMRFFHNGCPILIGNTDARNGFWFYSDKLICDNLLKTPKIYDFQKEDELAEGKNNLSELEIFEMNFN